MEIFIYSNNGKKKFECMKAMNKRLEWFIERFICA